MTSQSIFEELQTKAKSFSSYKELLESVGMIWKNYAGVLPVEIGPKDLVELAVLRKWIQQDEDGTIRIVLTKEGAPSTQEHAALESRRTCGVVKTPTRTVAAAPWQRTLRPRSANRAVRA